MMGIPLTKKRNKRLEVPKEKLKDKYYNPLTKQTLTYEENIRMPDIDDGWDYRKHLSSPRECVDAYIKEGKLIYVGK
jgi:hypothetical protein